MKKLFPLFALILSLLAIPLHADWVGSEIELESELTGGTYNITVLHPKSSRTQKLHVLVETSTSAQKFIEEWKGSAIASDSPALVVVALPEDQIQLNKDLTGDALKRVTGSGNAHKFYEFLNTVVLPKAIKLAGMEDHALEFTLHTHGKTAAFGFFAMFRKERDFNNFLFESPDMEWHEAYPFRGEYEFYKSMETELPVKAVFLPVIPETTEGSITMISMLKQLLGYRAYKGLECHFLDPVEIGASSDRLSILEPYL